MNIDLTTAEILKPLLYSTIGVFSYLLMRWLLSGPKHCTECQGGDDVMRVVVGNSATGKVVKRCYLCKSHRTVWRDKGYTITAD